MKQLFSAKSDSKITERNAYVLGRAHGACPGHPYRPEEHFTVNQKSLYSAGFDAGIDSLDAPVIALEPTKPTPAHEWTPWQVSPYSL